MFSRAFEVNEKLYFLTEFEAIMRNNQSQLKFSSRGKLTLTLRKEGNFIVKF